MSKSELRLSAGNEDQDDRGNGYAVAAVRPELKRPSMYRVVMLNDDYTPMEFVVGVLQMLFNMNLEQATQVMLAVHTQGKGLCGVFTKDIAETKAAQVIALARENQHPLMCEIERVE